MGEHTPGPWGWGEDADRAQEQIDKEEFEGEKYMDTQLFGANGQEIIPVRVDHYGMIYDGDWISDADRALIAAAPDLLAACEMALFYECGKECNECDQSGLPMCRRAESLACMLRTARDKARGTA